MTELTSNELASIGLTATSQEMVKLRAETVSELLRGYRAHLTAALFTSKRIADLFCSAIDCNDMTASWCDGIYLKAPDPDAEYSTDWWYCSPEVFEAEDLNIEVHEISDESTGEITKHTITKADIAEGTRIMLAKYPSHYADVIAENEDANTSDVFLQCVVLKDCIYG